MSANPDQVLIYHITDVENLPSILADGGLRSDAVMTDRNPTVIGYDHLSHFGPFQDPDTIAEDVIAAFLPT